MHLLQSRSMPAGVALVAVALAVVTGACLPAAIRPTPTPVVTPTPSPTVPPSTPTPGPPTPTPGPAYTTYTVKRGDTLTRIARTFQTDGRSIAYWNRDAYPSLDPESAKYSPDSLKVGWKLKILVGETYSPPPEDGETEERVTPEPSDDGDLEDPGASDALTEDPSASDALTGDPSASDAGAGDPGSSDGESSAP